MENTSIRLRKLMNERNLKQIDILKLTEPICQKYYTRLGKNDLSQYISGKVVPGQWKLFILSEALNVSEGWLMGLDVPMERHLYDSEIDSRLNFGFTLFELLKYYNMSEEELAKNIDIQTDIITKAIHAEKMPSDDDVDKIVKFFKIKNKESMFDNTLYNKIRAKQSEKEELDELDKLLFSKAKSLTDEEKKAVLQVMDAIHKDIDKELDNK